LTRTYKQELWKKIILCKSQ